MKKKRKKVFHLPRCMGGIKRKIRKVVCISFIEVCRWHLRSLWKGP